MFYAIFNDCLQRLLTLNKVELRKNLLKKIKMLSLEPGSNCLDFGCGTGLFAKVFIGEQLRYFGYDIDKRLTDYAARLYKNKKCIFATSIDELKNQAPFDMILANCCFHHIDDKTIDDVLTNINSLLDTNGTFLFIDIIISENDSSILRTLFRKIETGAFIRKAEDYKRLIEEHFTVINSEFDRSHFFAIKCISLYNNRIALVCKKKTSN